MILKNCQILENVLGILSFPSPILRFPSPKIQFSSPKIDFPRTKSDSPKSAFYFLQQLPLSSTAFWLSSTAFLFLQWLSDLSPMAFRFSSTAFRFPRNPRKSIYGKKYTKDCYSSFVFFATCSPSFVITAKQYLRLTQHATWFLLLYTSSGIGLYLCMLCSIWMPYITLLVTFKSASIGNIKRSFVIREHPKNFSSITERPFDQWSRTIPLLVTRVATRVCK